MGKKKVTKKTKTIRQHRFKTLEKKVVIKTVFDESTSVILIFHGADIWQHYLPTGYKLLPVYLDYDDNLISYKDAEEQRLAEQVHRSLVSHEVAIETTDVDLAATVIVVVNDAGSVVDQHIPSGLKWYFTDTDDVATEKGYDALCFVLVHALAVNGQNGNK